MAKTSVRGASVPRSWLEALDRHGIRYVIHKGELFYEDGELWKVLKLCRERKLPKGLC
ncbi:MAG: hypothetical protein GSR72_02190 [Desulfurococcales archaeon]|nr:hypothetical protein [Desulfurococcales archaeon]